MRSDHYTKVVLTVIALGLWALTMTQAGPAVSNVHAGVPPPPVTSEPVWPTGGYSQPSTVPPSPALPLRWRVRHAVLRYESGAENCLSVITVRNLGPSSTNVAVDWWSYVSTSAYSSTFSVAAGGTRTWGLKRLHITTYSDPFLVQYWGNVESNFWGSVHVHSDDPRISVAAFLRCDTAPADRVASSINSLPADPVGATMEYFQAGMPATWTPPVAAPEVPQ